jgi:serine/threonine protein kinase
MHANGYVHKDVKPANILSSPNFEGSNKNSYYLTDFGCAKTILHVSDLTDDEFE